jgi:hypothetical protein
LAVVLSSDIQWTTVRGDSDADGQGRPSGPLKMKCIPNGKDADEKEKKMSDITSILNQYRGGDFEQRLTLFLNYRDIRDEFVKIDEAELRANRLGEGLVHTECPVSSSGFSRCWD